MAAPSNEPKLVRPLMPSLLHIASAKIAVQLLNISCLQTLRDVFNEVQKGNSTTAEEVVEEVRKAKESLLLIPTNLRQTVMETVHGSYMILVHWLLYYESNFGIHLKVDDFRFRSDGTVDADKTAQDLVRREEFDVRERFKLACVFLLEESVVALWQEMETSGQTKAFETSNEYIIRFWVAWLRKRPQVNIAQSLGTLISRFPLAFDHPRALVPRCSTIFSLLRPEERRGCFHLLDKISFSFDDLRFCLYSLTREEEEEHMLRTRSYVLLNLHLVWPLQTMLLQIAAKIWRYIDDNAFCVFVSLFLRLTVEFRGLNHAELFEQFWHASPLHLRECVRERPELSQRIDSFFEERRREKDVGDGTKSRRE